MRKNQRSTLSGIDFTIDETGATGILKLSGALTEMQVKELSQKLESFDPHISYFKINFENITAVDLQSIQALYAACENLDRRNKTLVMDGLCPVTFTSAVENMGLSNRKWLCFGQL